MSLPVFDDVDSAPLTIQAAAASVVLVTLPGASATASFISPDGLLLTNNHVLGVGVCPVEGCYARLTFHYERGHAVEKPLTVFLAPKAIDIGLDMAVLQATASPGGPPLSTPNYLTIDSRTPTELQGTHVNVVGHPQGSVKKWTTGNVVWSDGDWVWTTAFILPGSSGSPLLDDHGHLVGLLHRSAVGLGLVTAVGVNESSIGTASAALLAAMGAPLPGSIESVAASTTAADVVDNEFVYLAAQTPTANVNGAPQQVLDALGAACDAALAVTDYPSPDDVASALQPCLDAQGWIECRADATTPYGVCPNDKSDWQRRYQAYFEYWRSFNGEIEIDEVSFGVAPLADSMADGQTAGAQALTQALSEAQPALDFHVAQHLAAFAIDTYEGRSIVDFVRNYGSVPDYALNGVELVSTILWLGNQGAIKSAELESLLGMVHSDPAIDLETKLFIELAEYNRGILP